MLFFLHSPFAFYLYHLYNHNNNQYNYSIDEVSIDNYSSSCEGIVCTNTLTGNKNITITKEWNDNNNSYNTRPSSINVKLKQNGNDYQTISLSGSGDTWTSDSIQVPVYDSEGVKYNYSVFEDNIDEYELYLSDVYNYLNQFYKIPSIDWFKKRTNP